MVQEFVSPVRVHKFPFEMVMAAYERRFPNCSQIPVVLECAITEDSWSDDDSQRDTSRRCQLNVDAPYLLKKMVGVDYIYFIQKNHLDLKARVLEIEATNESFANRVVVLEKCRYYVHPENPQWTCFEQSAHLDVTNFFGLESTVEKIAIKQYSANITKGKELIEVFMKGVESEGVTDLKPWTAADPEHNRRLRRIVSRNTEPLSPRASTDMQRLPDPGPSTDLKLPRTSTSKLCETTKKQPGHLGPPKIEASVGSGRKKSATGLKTVSKLEVSKRINSKHKQIGKARLSLIDPNGESTKASSKTRLTSKRSIPSTENVTKQVTAWQAGTGTLSLTEKIEEAKAGCSSKRSVLREVPDLSHTTRKANRGRLSLNDADKSRNTVNKRVFFIRNEIVNEKKRSQLQVFANKGSNTVRNDLKDDCNVLDSHITRSSSTRRISSQGTASRSDIRPPSNTRSVSDIRFNTAKSGQVMRSNKKSCRSQNQIEISTNVSPSNLSYRNVILTLVTVFISILIYILWGWQ